MYEEYSIGDVVQCIAARADSHTTLRKNYVIYATDNGDDLPIRIQLDNDAVRWIENDCFEIISRAPNIEDLEHIAQLKVVNNFGLKSVQPGQVVNIAEWDPDDLDDCARVWLNDAEWLSLAYFINPKTGLLQPFDGLNIKQLSPTVARHFEPVQPTEITLSPTGEVGDRAMAAARSLIAGR